MFKIGVEVVISVVILTPLLRWQLAFLVAGPVVAMQYHILLKNPRYRLSRPSITLVMLLDVPSLLLSALFATLLLQSPFLHLPGHNELYQRYGLIIANEHFPFLLSYFAYLGIAYRLTDFLTDRILFHCPLVQQSRWERWSSDLPTKVLLRSVQVTLKSSRYFLALWFLLGGRAFSLYMTLLDFFSISSRVDAQVSYQYRVPFYSNVHTLVSTLLTGWSMLFAWMLLDYVHHLLMTHQMTTLAASTLTRHRRKYFPFSLLPSFVHDFDVAFIHPPAESIQDLLSDILQQQPSSLQSPSKYAMIKRRWALVKMAQVAKFDQARRRQVYSRPEYWDALVGFTNTQMDASALFLSMSSAAETAKDVASSAMKKDDLLSTTAKNKQVGSVGVPPKEMPDIFLTEAQRRRRTDWEKRARVEEHLKPGLSTTGGPTGPGLLKMPNAKLKGTRAKSTEEKPAVTGVDLAALLKKNVPSRIYDIFQQHRAQPLTSTSSSSSSSKLLPEPDTQTLLLLLDILTYFMLRASSEDVDNMLRKDVSGLLQMFRDRIRVLEEKMRTLTALGPVFSEAGVTRDRDLKVVLAAMKRAVNVLECEYAWFDDVVTTYNQNQPHLHPNHYAMEE